MHIQALNMPTENAYIQKHLQAHAVMLYNCHP